jgi:multidrug efflux system membrane fusion protein
LGALLLLLSIALGEAERLSFGYLEPYKIFKLSVAEPGILLELPVKEGDVVKQGQILARLDCRVLEQELGAGRAQLAYVRSKFAKYEELQQSGRLAPEEYEKAKTELVVEQHKVGRTEAEIERHTLRSPADGVVSEVKRNLGESVTLTGPHILTVVQIDRLALVLYILPEVARGLKAGDPVRVKRADTGELLEAAVEFVSPVTDSASNTVRVKIIVPNAERKVPTGVQAELMLKDGLG